MGGGGWASCRKRLSAPRSLKATSVVGRDAEWTAPKGAKPAHYVILRDGKSLGKTTRTVTRTRRSRRADLPLHGPRARQGQARGRDVAAACASRCPKRQSLGRQPAPTTNTVAADRRRSTPTGTPAGARAGPTPSPTATAEPDAHADPTPTATPTPTPVARPRRPPTPRATPTATPRPRRPPTADADAHGDRHPTPRRPPPRADATPTPTADGHRDGDPTPRRPPRATRAATRHRDADAHAADRHRDADADGHAHGDRDARPRSTRTT